MPACAIPAVCDFFPGFYVDGQLLGADGCPLKNTAVQLDWGTARDAERAIVGDPAVVFSRTVSTDEAGRFEIVLSTFPMILGIDFLICPTGADWYEPTDLEMMELTIDAADVVETIEVQIAEEMIIGSNSFSEIDIDLGVIMLQDSSTCGEDATGDES